MQLLLIAAVLAVAGIVLITRGKSYTLRNVPKPLPYLIILAAVAFAIASAVVVIPAGHAGVPVLFGKVQDNPLTEGLHLINPLLEVQRMSVRTEAYTMSSIGREGQLRGDDSITVLSKDGLRMPLDITVQYRLVASDAPYIYRTLGLNYVEKVIRPASRTAIREAASQFTAQEAYSTRRGELGAQTQEALEHSIKKLLREHKDFRGDGFIIQQVLLRNVTLPARLQAAIEEKLSAEQAAQQMEFVLAKERKEADRKKIEAAGIAEFQRIVSQGISGQLLKWKGIDATLKIAESPNAKIVIIGTSENGLPVILNTGKD